MAAGNALSWLLGPGHLAANPDKSIPLGTGVNIISGVSA